MESKTNIFNEVASIFNSPTEIANLLAESANSFTDILPNLISGKDKQRESEKTQLASFPKSSYTTWTASQMSGGDKLQNRVYHLNESPEIELKNFKIGECFNLYENLVLNSKWDVRDDSSCSSIVLARNHMFYFLFDTQEKKIHNLISNKSLITKGTIETYIDSRDPYRLLDNAKELFFQLELDENYDSGTIALTMKDNGSPTINKSYDSSLYDTMTRTSVRRFSENHFVISGYNLIFSEFAVNDDIVNTVSQTYTKQTINTEKTIMTILPVSNTDGYNSEFVREKNIVQSMSQLETDTVIFADSDNKFRSIENLTNTLIKELEYSYQGKIISKYIHDIQIGDTITLIDDVNSTFGKFRVETFEHIFDYNGMVTISNIKACFDLVDPSLDIYSNNITISLLSDLGIYLEDNSVGATIDSNIVIKNIYSYYSKILFQNPKYCTIFHKSDKGWFDEYYPIYSDNTFANPMALRMFPVMKKGKIQIPESIKTAFYVTENSPMKSIFRRIYNVTHDKMYNLFKSFKSWGIDAARYLGDFLISIPTFNLHELFKAKLGMKINDARKTVFSSNDPNSDQLSILLDDIDYSKKWGLGIKSDLVIGFFNVQAQKKNNLTPEIKNDSYIADDETLNERLKEKEYNIKKIISDVFDVSLCVEVYDGFTFNNGYTHDNFIENITPAEYRTEKHQIFNNTYGNEYGVKFMDNSEIVAECNPTSNPISFLGSASPINNSTSELNRCYVETNIDISSFCYVSKNTSEGPVYFENLKIVWFHNLFGSSGADLATRKQNIRSIINKYNMIQDNKTAVIIMGDFNLEVVNYNKLPSASSAADYNAVFRLESNDGFINRINKPTTLNKKGLPQANIYDNVLISKNLHESTKNKNLINIGRYVYPHSKKQNISDHIPVYISLTKRKRSI